MAKSSAHPAVQSPSTPIDRAATNAQVAAQVQAHVEAHPQPAPQAAVKGPSKAGFDNLKLWAPLPAATSTIKVLTRNADGSIRNPKLAGKGPALRFAKYVDGITVAQALAAGLTAADVRWDLAHGYIAVA